MDESSTELKLEKQCRALYSQGIRVSGETVNGKVSQEGRGRGSMEEMECKKGREEHVGTHM